MASKRYCFTLNNYTESEEAALKVPQEEEIDFLIFGREVGETGTAHLQGYLELKRRVRFGGVHLILPVLKRSHLEVAKGKADDNVTYCSKGGDIYSWGQPTGGQGTRTDLAEILELARTGPSRRKLLEEGDPNTLARFWKFFTAISSLHPPTEGRIPPEVFIIWGPTGSGKTRAIYDNYDAADIWGWPGQAQWFDGYDGHDVALFDDFYGEISLPNVLKLTDRYPLQLPVKGGWTWFYPKRIFFTSNQDPETWYPARDMDALWRRIAGITELGYGENSARIYSVYVRRV